MAEHYTGVRERRKANGGIVICKFDDESTTRDYDEAFLKDLLNGLREYRFVVQLKEVKDLEDIRNEQIIRRPILAYPDEPFCNSFLENVVTFEVTLHDRKESLILIIRKEKFLKLPDGVKELQIRQVLVDRIMPDVKGIINDLWELLQDVSKSVDFAFINSGTGLAASYYFGYLMPILPDLKENIRKSAWRESHPDIHENRISKKLFVVFTTNCLKPTIVDNERIKFSEPIIKLEKFRAGLKRKFNLKVLEVKSKDRKESYYGIVRFLTVVQVLTEMRDDPNKDFVKFSENDMRKQGKHCFEKLKLFMKYPVNETIEIDQSTIDFIEFNTEAENPDEKNLADVIFDHMRESCTSDVSHPVHEAGTTGANITGILYDAIPGDAIPGDIKKFVDDLANSDTTKQITDCPPDDNHIEFGLNLIEESKRIFMVLTDDFVKSDAFAKWSYKILDKGYREKNRRFVVCLNCLSQTADHPNVLELWLLFTNVSYTQGWDDKVRAQLLKDDVLDITNDLKYINIGAGLAMSWYYRFLKIRVPKLRDVIDKCPALKEKFDNSQMSHKVFFLHPSSCRCPILVSKADPKIQLVKNEVINLPKVMKAKEDYTPQVYCVRDVDGKEYYAFVEFNTQADTMYKMMKEEFLSDSVLTIEWNRFYNKLCTLIYHDKEPMDIRNRTVFIRYNDEDSKDGELARILLDHVQREIKKEKRGLPAHIENGATVE